MTTGTCLQAVNGLETTRDRGRPRTRRMNAVNRNLKMVDWKERGRMTEDDGEEAFVTIAAPPDDETRKKEGGWQKTMAKNHWWPLPRPQMMRQAGGNEEERWCIYNSHIIRYPSMLTLYSLYQHNTSIRGVSLYYVVTKNNTFELLQYNMNVTFLFAYYKPSHINCCCARLLCIPAGPK